MLPEWVVRNSRTIPDHPLRRQSIGKPRRYLSEFLKAVQTEALRSRSASRPGFLQSFDPRAKSISILALVVATSMTHSLFAPAVSLTLAICAALASRIDRRAWLTMTTPAALLAIAIAAPAVFNVFTPGPALLDIARLGHERRIWGWTTPETLSVTSSGAIFAVRFVLRAAACVCWASVLTLTTRWPELLSALRSLGLPHLFVMTLALMYRYVFTLVRRAEEMRIGKESRTIGCERTIETDRRIAARIGRLFQFSRQLADEVYLAMAARGFHGGVRTVNKSNLRGRDFTVGAAAICAAVFLVIVDRALKSV